MRFCKIQQQETTLQEAMSNFFNYKKAQQVADRIMRDYEHYLSEFLKHSHTNSKLVSYYKLLPKENIIL